MKRIESSDQAFIIPQVAAWCMFIFFFSLSAFFSLIVIMNSLVWDSKSHDLADYGSHIILGDLTSQAYNFMTLNRKNFISSTPLKVALNAFNLALNASADALVSLSLKKFKILS